MADEDNKLKKAKQFEKEADKYNASQIQVLGGLEAVRMREREEAVLLQLGLPRTVSYTNDEILYE